MSLPERASLTASCGLEGSIVSLFRRKTERFNRERDIVVLRRGCVLAGVATGNITGFYTAEQEFKRFYFPFLSYTYYYLHLGLCRPKLLPEHLKIIPSKTEE